MPAERLVGEVFGENVCNHFRGHNMRTFGSIFLDQSLDEVEFDVYVFGTFRNTTLDHINCCGIILKNLFTNYFDIQLS